MASKSTIAITGGSGYIGSTLACELSEFFDVLLLDIKPPTKMFPSNINFKKCDLRNYDEIYEAICNVDLVIHTAIIQIPAINDQKTNGYEVNILGTQNVCRAVYESQKTKGLILSGSWHTIGERELKGLINEEFGFRPDKVEERARLYALSKMAQESIVRFYDEMSSKIFGIIRMGTVIGEGMPEKTAANIFIENGLKGKALTPFKQSMYRPMLYVDIYDICKAFKLFADRILKNQMEVNGNSMDHIFNVYHDQPITIADLAELTKEAIVNESKGRITPEIQIIDDGRPMAFNKADKTLMKVDTSKALRFLGISELKSPRESIECLVKSRINSMTS